jgi:hypothetical protein
MIVVCIDVSPKRDWENESRNLRLLTLNKKYKVIKERVDSYEIVVDDGLPCEYRKIRFISLEQIRNNILNELGI